MVNSYLCSRDSRIHHRSSMIQNILIGNFLKLLFISFSLCALILFLKWLVCRFSLNKQSAETWPVCVWVPIWVTQIRVQNIVLCFRLSVILFSLLVYTLLMSFLGAFFRWHIFILHMNMCIAYFNKFCFYF